MLTQAGINGTLREHLISAGKRNPWTIWRSISRDPGDYFGIFGVSSDNYQSGAQHACGDWHVHECGRSSGVALALGVAADSFVWAVLTVVGLSALLATYTRALIVIKIFGGFYLLWLACKSFKAAASRQDIEATELAGGKRSKFGYAKRGLIVQMTNPEAALAWIAIISPGLPADAPVWVGSVIVIGTLALSLLVYGFYAVAFSTQIMVRLYSRARHYIQATLGAFFAFAGIKLLLSRS